MQQMSLKTQDLEIFNLNLWTVTQRNDLFKLTEMKNMPYEIMDETWVQVTVEMSLNRLEFTRSRFTFLDMLA